MNLQKILEFKMESDLPKLNFLETEMHNLLNDLAHRFEFKDWIEAYHKLVK